MTAKATLTKKLIEIQAELVATKNLENKFGGYKYRSCEGILEAVKPHLKKHGLTLTLSDDIVAIGQYAFVKATATLSDGASEVVVTACARDSIERKGMDAAQITGAASSYSRKYALNGLFAIDDTKDADATNDHKTANARKSDNAKQTQAMEETLDAMGSGGNFDDMDKIMQDNAIKALRSQLESNDEIADWMVKNEYPKIRECTRAECDEIIKRMN